MDQVLKIWLAGSILGFVILGIWVAVGRSDQPKVNDVRNFMWIKLDDSKRVLEGLTVEDFDLVIKNSQAMSLLSEDAAWQILQTAEYAQRGVSSYC
jgi:hypothetical protein